ncbi:MAG: hypothetical protein JNM17_38005, partial [Archangium sp.]|nr:hypothetical protein [Archangium sp.]
MNRMWVLAVVAFGACRRPCVENGEYAFFARRAANPAAMQQGACPETIEGTVTWHADGGASFHVAGFEGSCTRSQQDLRPNFEICAIALDCNGRSQSGLASLAFTGVTIDAKSDAGVIDGFQDMTKSTASFAKWTQNDT